MTEWRAQQSLPPRLRDNDLQVGDGGYMTFEFRMGLEPENWEGESEEKGNEGK